MAPVFPVCDKERFLGKAVWLVHKQVRHIITQENTDTLELMKCQRENQPSLRSFERRIMPQHVSGYDLKAYTPPT